MTGKSATVSSMESRAIALLTANIPAVKVAEALNVTPARISQMLESQEFKEALAEARFAHLNRHNEADAKLDQLESTCVEKLSNVLELVHNPMQLTKIFTALNGAKRRGVSTLADTPDSSTIVSLTMPTKVVNNFQVNINNQVVRVGNEDLVTIQHQALQKLALAANTATTLLEGETE